MKLKRMLAALTCLALLCPCALAAQGDRSFLEGNEPFASGAFPSGGCVAGDALYMFSSDQIYVWRAGDDAPSTVRFETDANDEEPNEPDELDAEMESDEDADDAVEVEAVSAADGTHTIARLFADGGRLLALRGVYGFEDDEYQGLTGLEIAEVTIDGDRATLGAPLEVDAEDLSTDYGYGPELASICGCACAGGKLYLDVYGDAGERRLVCVDLDDGETEALDLENLEGICAYDGDRLLVETFDPDAQRLEFSILDPQGDAMTRACEPIPAEEPLECFAWSVESGRLLWLDAGYVMAAQGFDLASAEPVAEIAARFLDEASAYLLPGDLYALVTEFEGIFVRATEPGALPETQIVVQGGGIFQAMIDGYYDFNASHSDATAVLREVYDESTVLADIMSRDDSADVRVTMASDETFSALRERGLLAPITDPGLIQAVSEMYPAIQDALTLDGALIAVPIYAAGWTLGLDYEGFERIGIPESEVPDNWPDLLDLLPTLPERLPEDESVRIFPEYTDQTQVRTELIKLILDSWLLYLRANELELNYDDPYLCAALEKAMALDLDALGVKPGGDDYASLAVAAGGYREVGERDYTLVNTNVDCTLTGLGYNRPAALSVIPGEDTPLPLDLAVLYINPYSKHTELAQEYIADVYANLDDYALYNLSSARNEPLESPSYAQAIADANRAVEEAKAKLAEAEPEDAPRWEQAVEDNEAIRDTIEANRYRISPESIDWYREHAGSMLVRSYSFVDPTDPEGEFYDLIQQFLAGRTDAASFLKEIDRRVQMKAREG